MYVEEPILLAESRHEFVTFLPTELPILRILKDFN